VDNKFVTIRVGDLANVEEISIIDEESYKKRSAGKVKKKYAFTTTQGNYDPDHMNWYAVLEEGDYDLDVLVLVRRSLVPVTEN
jgi:hypothetical protein